MLLFVCYKLFRTQFYLVFTWLLWLWMCPLPPSRCSQQVNSTLEEQDVITITVFSPLFGKTGVESRVNVSTRRFHTLECVATVEGEQAYTLFSISGGFNSATLFVQEIMLKDFMFSLTSVVQSKVLWILVASCVFNLKTIFALPNERQNSRAKKDDFIEFSLIERVK